MSRKWFIAIAVAVGALLEIIDTSIVNVALTDMQNTLGATLSQITWVVSSYVVANVIILPLSAWLGDRFGKKRYFVFSLIGFTCASVLCGLATSLPMLIVARVLQGLAGGGLLAKAQSILFETFPREEQPAAQGFFGAIVIAGPAIGPTLGGWIVTNIDWRWIFFINVPVGIAAIIMCMTFLPNDVAAERVTGKVDWAGIGLLAVGLGCLQTVLEEGQADDWFESRFITVMFVTAVLGLVGFVWRELTADKPVVDLRVLRYRSLWAGSILSIVVGIGLYGALFAIPIFTQSILGLTPEQTGWLLLPGAIASAVAMVLASRLAKTWDPRAMIVAGAGVLVVALYMLMQLTAQSGTDDFFWPLIIRGAGTVLMFLPLSLATIGPIPKRDIAKATGFYSLTRQLGGSVGVALLATVLADREVFHRTILVEKLVANDPNVLARVATLQSGLVARGYDVAGAHSGALRLLSGGVDVQAAVQSFNDTFWLTALLFIASLPLVLLLGKATKGAPVPSDH
jgi:DHA2 family multidrug resistance protein